MNDDLRTLVCCGFVAAPVLIIWLIKNAISNLTDEQREEMRKDLDTRVPGDW